MVERLQHPRFELSYTRSYRVFSIELMHFAISGRCAVDCAKKLGVVEKTEH